MTIERAIEILDPEHREVYDSIETVNEACRMGMDALKQQEERERETDICGQALECWGAYKQILIAVEELAELQKALLKYQRYGSGKKWREDVLEEMADVEIVLCQLEMIFGCCRSKKQFKLQRLKKRAAGEMPGQTPYLCQAKELSQMPCFANDDIQCEACEKAVPVNE